MAPKNVQKFAEVAPQAIAVQFRFDRKVIAQVKALDGKWIDDANLWIMPITLDAIEWIIDNDFELSPQSQFQIEKFLNESAQSESLRKIRKAWSAAIFAEPIPEVLSQITTDLQVAPFQWVPCYYSRLTEHKFLISDPQGTGKSVEATLVTMLPENQNLNVLITSPANAVYNWQKELMTHFGFKAHVITQPITRLLPGIRYYIVSYNMADRMQIEQPFFLIADESADIKNKRANRTKKIKQISLRCPKKICMSGTPVPNRPEEAWQQLDILMPGFMTYTNFTKRYCSAYFDHQRGGINVLGNSNLLELHNLLFENYLVRRDKAKVLPQLPQKMRQTVTINNKSVTGESVLEMYAQNALLKSCDSDFKEWIMDLFSNALDEDKVLLFYHHKTMGQALENHCKEFGVKYLHIDGATPKHERQRLVDLFQNDPSQKVFILSIMAASTSITLTAANISVFCELVFSAGVLSQAEDRTHRMGQAKTCLLFYPFLTQFEHYVWDIIMQKMLVQDKIYNGAGQDGEQDQSILQRIAQLFNMPVQNKSTKTKSPKGKVIPLQGLINTLQ